MADNLPQKQSEILIYQTQDGRTRIDVRLENETVWLSLNQMAELFQRDKSVISRHIHSVFKEGELQPEATVAKFATVQAEGERQVSRAIDFYNLDVIISVGYRVKSHRGTQFRIWATQRLKEYIIKGFALNDERFMSDNSMNLKEDEIKLLGLLVEQYLAFAETMAQQRTPMYMKDWIARLDAIIQLNGRELLTHAGKISHQMALEKSALEFEKYRETQSRIQQEESLRELEQDIQQLQPHQPNQKR